jgi:hypothetical protein
MAKRYTSASIWPLSSMEGSMKVLLKKVANSLTVAVSVLLMGGFVYVLAHSLPLGDFIYSIAFCYLAIAVLNYLVFGTAKLWHKPDELN